jgi:hypothetical protein
MASDEAIQGHRHRHATTIMDHQLQLERWKRGQNPEGAFDHIAGPRHRAALAFDDFTPRPPASGVDPRPTSDRGRKARDQSQPPPARNRSMLHDADPQAVKARLEKVLGPEGLEDLRRLLNGNGERNGNGDEDNERNGNAHGEVGTDQEPDEDDINNAGGGSRLTAELMTRIQELCNPHLSNTDQSELEQMLTQMCGDDLASDQPPDFAGKPNVGGALTPNAPRNGTGAPPRPSPSGADASRRTALDHALHRIRLETTGVQPTRRPAPPPRPRLKSDVIAQDAAASASRQSFASRFPDVARIKCL